MFFVLSPRGYSTMCEKLYKGYDKFLFYLKIKRFLSSPFRTIKNRLGIHDEKINWKRETLRGNRWWPKDLYRLLQKLPEEFFSSYSLTGNAVLWLYTEIIKKRPRVIVECGSGLSTIVIAYALSLYEEEMSSNFYSLENDERWLKLTESNAAMLGLTDYIELIHSQMSEYIFEEKTYYSYKLSALVGLSIDLLLIDGPSPKYGRYAVLPSFLDALSENAQIILDDVYRQSEKKCLDSWTSLADISLIGYIPKGHGLALLQKCTNK